MVKLLSEQAKDTPGVGDNDQAVMALVTPSLAVADLAELIVQGGDVGVVQFGKVVQAKGRASVVEELLSGAMRVRKKDLGVSDFFCVHKIVVTPQGIGILELVGHGAIGMSADPVRQINERLVSADIAELGSSEMLDAIRR